MGAFFTFDVLRFDDLLWAYMKVIKKSVNLVPVGKDCQALLHCRGGKMTFQSSEGEVQDVVARCAQRAPWAFIGFSQELLGHFTKNNPAFCEAVEARRRELQQSKGPGAEKS